MVINKPTIDVAKSLLCGEVGAFDHRGWAPVVDRGRVIGAAVVPRPGQAPIYVSVGHQVSLEGAVNVVMNCMRAHIIPEPIRIAYGIANEEGRKLRPHNTMRISTCNV